MGKKPPRVPKKKPGDLNEGQTPKRPAFTKYERQNLERILHDIHQPHSRPKFPRKPIQLPLTLQPKPVQRAPTPKLIQPAAPKPLAPTPKIEQPLTRTKKSPIRKTRIRMGPRDWKRIKVAIMLTLRKANGGWVSMEKLTKEIRPIFPGTSDIQIQIRFFQPIIKGLITRRKIEKNGRYYRKLIGTNRV